MKSILRLGYIVIIMILIGCNRINHVKHENNTSSRSSLSEALLSQEDNALKPEEAVPFYTTVDSVKIVLWNLAEMEFHVYPNVAGYACMESDTIVLSRQYCQIVLNTIDTLFMKKIIPVVETITWQKMATCMDSHPYYYIHVYHNGKCYKRRISYVSNSGQYEYKFSNMFTFSND